MNMLRFGTNIFERSSPVGLIVGGLAVALAIPPVRRGLRALAVTAAGGIITVGEEAKRLAVRTRTNLHDLAEEAQSKDDCPSCDDFSEALQEVRSAPRQLAVKATAGVLAVSDKAKSLLDEAAEQFRTIAEEARQKRGLNDMSEAAPGEDNEPLEH